MLRMAGLIFLVFASAYGLAQTGGEAFKPGKLSKEDIAKLRPGLTLRFLDEANKPLDARSVRMAALHVPLGAAPSVRIAPGLFHASLTGLLKLPLRGDYQFKLQGSGEAALLLNDKPIAKLEKGTGKESPPIELVKGYNKFEIRYRSPENSDATIRVSWAGDGFHWEPLPPDALFSRLDDADLTDGMPFREGRVLFATRGCAHCHQLPENVSTEKWAMPEMRHQAPALANAGHRFQESALAAWIADPKSLRAEATMPRVLIPATRDRDASDIAAFLMGLKDGQLLGKSEENADAAAAGEKLFMSLGCITCHHLEKPTQKDSYGRLSLHYVSAKHTRAGLEAFLHAPQQHYPWTRMPDLKLTDAEASALASHLFVQPADHAKNLPQQPAGDPTRGKALFATAGCAQCHSLKAGDALPRPAQAFPKDLAKGCLAGSGADRGEAPDFDLTSEGRAALRAFVQEGLPSLTRETPAEFSWRQTKELQCTSCHTRDGAPSRWYVVLTDEGGGLQPEYLPHLTWTGQKLHPEWIEKLLAGTQDHRARPWLKARMPAFPARAQMLATGLSHEHGYAPDEDPKPAQDAQVAAIGAKLLPQAGGFNCVQCHAVADQKAMAPFEAEGINLLDAALRLRYDFFARWMLEPARVDPTTRMTKFTTDGKTTAIADILDGDARRQFDAIWHYIQTLPAKSP
jgi:mono/diheme cytochrome c family protein